MKFDSLSESDQAYFIHKASTLVEALPYIRKHSGKNIVIKYGGHAMGNEKLAKSFSQEVGLLKEVGINPIVVHGGGPQIGEMLKKKNIKSNFVEGLRVTDVETVKIVEEVLSKDIILELYLNDIYLGYGSYGGAASSLNYFNKTLQELNLEEMAYLAALPKAPNNYHPIKSIKTQSQEEIGFWIKWNQMDIFLKKILN